MYTARLLLILALALSVTAEAQASRRSRARPKKPPATQPVPAPVQAPQAAQPPSEPSEPVPAKPAIAAPEAPARQPIADGTVVFAIPRSSNAETAAAKLQEELVRLLGSKPDVQLVELGAAFPPPALPSLQGADVLYEEGKTAYDNLDPEAAAAKFSDAVSAYEKHPAAFKPQQLAKTFIFLGASQLLNGDKQGAKASFLRALAADPGTQPEQGLFGSDVQTAFAGAQKEFKAQRPGTLVIDSRPSGARVTVRGEDVGVTPLQSVSVHPGRHPVIISLPGYVPYASYPQVASSKSAELKPQLEPLPALAEVLAAAGRASSERGFDSSTLPLDVATIADKVGARYVVLAAVRQKKSDPAQAELQVWDVRTKNRLRGVELELPSLEPETSTGAAADQVHGFLTGRPVASPSSSSNLPPVMKKPWFWAAVVGGAAVVTGGIIYASQARKGDPLGPVSGLPGLGF